MSVSVSATARRIAAATAVAAAALGAVALPAAAAPQHHHRSVVAISDVHAEALGRRDHSNRSLNKQWVDITNSTRRAVNLDGWTLTDRDGHRYTFRHFWLDGRATVRVHTGEGRDNREDVYQDRGNSVWDHNGDTATLRDNRGRFIDDVSWGHRRNGGGDHDGDHGGDHHGGNHHGGDHHGGDHHGGDHHGGGHHGGDIRR